ncbi:tetratricopeptide repeat protein [Patescibacteria group bacterium]|nr:MAG: tetratricopeptide repeat protein [Patescibacteria group bacterium]
MPLRPKQLLVIVSAAVVVIVGGLWAGKSWRATHPAAPALLELVDRGIDAENMAKFEERIAAQEAAVAEGERDISELLVLGNLYYSVGDLKKAAAAYRDILSSNPNDSAAHENLAQALIEMGDYAGAEAQLRAAADVSAYEPTYLKLADLIDEHFPARRAEIQVILEAAIGNLGQTPGLLTRLGKWYADNGMLKEAISHYEVARQLAPDDQAIQAEIERLEAEQRKKAK